MLLTDIFMIRNGSTGIIFDVKLYITLGSILLCYYDKKVNNRNDYFYVFICGTIIWFLVELVAQLTGIRQIPNKILFGYAIPLWLSLPLQAVSEGSVFAIVGLFFGDRLIFPLSELKSKNETFGKIKKQWIIWAIAFIIMNVIMFYLLLSQGVPEKDVGGDVNSRRAIFALPSLIFMGIFTIVVIIWLIKVPSKDARNRVLAMMGFMTVTAIVWTMGEFIANTRWIEVLTSTQELVRAPPLIEVFTFAYDIIVEFAFIFASFFIIPHKLKLIK